MNLFISRYSLIVTLAVISSIIGGSIQSASKDTLAPQPRFTMVDADQFAVGTVTDQPNDAEIRSNIQSIELVASGSVNCFIATGPLKPGQTEITSWSVTRIQSFDPAVAQIRFLDAAGNDTIIRIQAPPSRPFVSINGSNSICQGESRQLTAIGKARHYLWSTGDTSSTIVARPLSNTGYWVTVTNTAGETFLSDSIIVYVQQFPSIILYRQANSNTLYADSVAPFSRYIWFRNDSLISGANERSLTVTQSGRYSVYVTSGPMCSKMSNVIYVTDLSSSVSESSDGISIYPNPVEDLLNVRCGSLRPNAFTILNALGQSESESSIVNATDLIRIDVKSLSAGRYTLLLRSGTKTQSIPFVRK